MRKVEVGKLGPTAESVGQVKNPDAGREGCGRQ